MDPNLYNATIGAPSASPNILGASSYGEISNLGAIDRKLPTSMGLANEHLGAAQETVEAQRAAAAAAAKAKALAEQKKADLSDPSKYRKQKKADGGFDFYDPDGNQIDIATLTQRTQTKALDWIDDSENPIDIQYREDQSNLNAYIQAKLGGDVDKAKKYEEAEPGLSKYQGKGGAHQLMEDFKNHYKRYYIPSQWGERPSDKLVVPRGGEAGEDDEFGL